MFVCLSFFPFFYIHDFFHPSFLFFPPISVSLLLSLYLLYHATFLFDFPAPTPSVSTVACSPPNPSHAAPQINVATRNSSAAHPKPLCLTPRVPSPSYPPESWHHVTLHPIWLNPVKLTAGFSRLSPGSRGQSAATCPLLNRGVQPLSCTRPDTARD